MTNWIVSAHATANRMPAGNTGATYQLVQLPAGVRFYFFEDEGAPLAVAKAWPLYDLLMKAQPTSQDFIAVSQTPGYRKFDQPALPDYVIRGDNQWVDKHHQLASGIFVQNDEFHQNPMTYYMRGGQTYTLSQFFSDPALSWKAGDQVYWLACRSWL